MKRTACMEAAFRRVLCKVIRFRVRRFCRYNITIVLKGLTGFMKVNCLCTKLTMSTYHHLMEFDVYTAF